MKTSRISSRRKHLATAIITVSVWFTQPALGATPVDPSLRPKEQTTQQITNVYRDMVVVQRKAKNKAGRALFHAFGSFDFSDGPRTMYGLNLNFGYALSDYWEIYANYVPVFASEQRPMAKEVSKLLLADGDTAEVNSPIPKSQYGLELLWAPAYGKDSWGPYSIVRSDTFLKFAAGVIQYTGTSGNRFALTVGKTFFINRLLNFRIAAGGAYLESTLQFGKKEVKKRGYTAGILECGMAWYF